MCEFAQSLFTVYTSRGMTASLKPVVDTEKGVLINVHSIGSQ